MIPKIITVHCAATPNGVEYDIAKLRDFHVKFRGWSDVGYHVVVQPSGNVQWGRELDTEGAHVTGHNNGNIGICLPGTDKFTSQQFVTLKNLIGPNGSLYTLAPTLIPWEIYCHNEFDTAKAQGKTCPGFPIRPFLWWLWMGDRKVLKPYMLEDKT